MTTTTENSSAVLRQGDAVAFENVSMVFPGGVHALSDLTLSIRAGEVHGLVGHNGSGKSTLVKVLCGYLTPDRGSRVFLWGSEVTDSFQSLSQGVAVVHQDLGVVGDLTVVENIGVTMRFGARPAHPINRRAQDRRAVSLLETIGVRLDPRQKVGELAPFERASVAIARALGRVEASGGRVVLVLDETGAYMSGDDAQNIYGLARRVAEMGGAACIISHRLAEVLRNADRVSVMREGRLVGTYASADIDESGLVERMFGQAHTAVAVRARAGPEEELLVEEMDTLAEAQSAVIPPTPEVAGAEFALEAEGLVGETLAGLNLAVKPGEIVGLTGVVGAGYEEAGYLIGGGRRRLSGRVKVYGEAIVRDGPRAARCHGVVLLSPDRLGEGAWADGTVRENYSIPFLRRYFQAGILSKRAEGRAAMAALIEYNVRPRDPDRDFRTLSGGNQQKVLLARSLHEGPRVLVLVEPTRGVDVASVAEILQQIRRASQGGCAVLVCSVEYGELAAVCHRVAVLDAGVVKRELVGGELSERAILRACHI